MTRRRAVALTLAAAAVAAVFGQGAVARSESETLRAFQRANRPADVLRSPIVHDLQITDTRRIATYVDRRGRRATLYVGRSRTDLCHLLVKTDPGKIGGISAGCSPASKFFGDGHVAAASGRLFTGVAANAVARVVIVGSRGVRHPVDVTADGGFIYDCRAYNGCAGLIACVEAYRRNGQFLSGLAWGSGGCKRP